MKHRQFSHFVKNCIINQLVYLTHYRLCDNVLCRLMFDIDTDVEHIYPLEAYTAATADGRTASPGKVDVLYVTN